MKDNFTRIAIILDRSGSMESCKESTVAGFNEFIRTQKELPGEATVKLVQFDDQYETVFDKPLKELSGANTEHVCAARIDRAAGCAGTHHRRTGPGACGAPGV